MTTLWARWLRICGSFPIRGKRLFFFSKVSRLAWAWSWPATLSSAKVNDLWNYTSMPTCQRNNCTLNFTLQWRNFRWKLVSYKNVKIFYQVHHNQGQWLSSMWQRAVLSVQQSDWWDNVTFSVRWIVFINHVTIFPGQYIYRSKSLWQQIDDLEAGKKVLFWRLIIVTFVC